jgi:antitoxin CptB
MIGAASALVSHYNSAMELEPDAEYNRLCWHSRRGMLELDLVLGPFVRQHYPILSAADQARYKRLLRCEDQDLFAWLMGRESPPDEELAVIVEKILATTRA